MPRPPTPTASASSLGLIRKTAGGTLTRSNSLIRHDVFGAEALLCFQQKRLGIFCKSESFWMSEMPPLPTDHAEFARCPQPLPMGSPSLPVSSCELNKNTRRCHQQPLATHLSCRLYQTCDHAVLISGTHSRVTKRSYDGKESHRDTMTVKFSCTPISGNL